MARILFVAAALSLLTVPTDATEPIPCDALIRDAEGCWSAPERTVVIPYGSVRIALRPRVIICPGVIEGFNESLDAQCPER